MNSHPPMDSTSTPSSTLVWGVPKPAAPIVVRPGADPVVPGIPAAIADLIRAGEFAHATEALGKYTEARTTQPGDPSVGVVLRQQELLRRIANDYGLTRADLNKRMHDRLRDYSPDELEEWIAEGIVDRMMLNGEERFMGSSAANLLYLKPELKARRKTSTSDRLGAYVAEEIGRLRAEAGENSTALLSPRRLVVKMKLSTTVPQERVGQILRAWMPYPQENHFQRSIRILDSSPAPSLVAPPLAEQRTVYFERKVSKGGPVEFRLTYEFSSLARVNRIEASEALALPEDSPARRWVKEEPPHVQFSEPMQALYREICGEESNPAVIARLCYDWIADNVRYAYAREYSTLSDIGLYCGARRAGDCGQLALLYITLCRMGGVPARWQSAWVDYPHWEGMHDWTEIYIEPYGWVPVDPYMAQYASRYFEGLSPEDRSLIRDFYFGSMDAHRLVANSAHGAAFQPPKKSWRADDVDNQRGELEWADGTGLFFNEYDYEMRIEEVVAGPTPLPEATYAPPPTLILDPTPWPTQTLLP